MSKCWRTHCHYRIWAPYPDKGQCQNWREDMSQVKFTKDGKSKEGKLKKLDL